MGPTERRERDWSMDQDDGRPIGRVTRHDETQHKRLKMVQRQYLNYLNSVFKPIARKVLSTYPNSRKNLTETPDTESGLDKPIESKLMWRVKIVFDVDYDPSPFYRMEPW